MPGFRAGIVGIIAANMANVRLVGRFGPDALMRGGTGLATAAGLRVAFNASTDLGGLLGPFFLLFAFASATGFIVANSIASAMGECPQRAGAVSALVGSAQYGSGVVGSSVIGIFADGTVWPMGWVIALTSTGSLLCAWFLVPARPLLSSAAREPRSGHEYRRRGSIPPRCSRRTIRLWKWHGGMRPRSKQLDWISRESGA